MSVILRMEHTPLSDSNIRTILGQDAKIIKYSELSQFSNINELLQKPIDFVVILFEEEKDSGHWLGLMKYNGLFEVFDSYGFPVDRELKWINLKRRRTLNELTPYLSNLLGNETHIHNKVKYQQEDIGIETCGDHVCHRIFRLVKNNMDLEQYQNYMKVIRDSHNMSYDQVVADFVANLLK